MKPTQQRQIKEYKYPCLGYELVFLHEARRKRIHQFKCNIPLNARLFCALLWNFQEFKVLQSEIYTLELLVWVFRTKAAALSAQFVCS